MILHKNFLRLFNFHMDQTQVNSLTTQPHVQFLYNILFNIYVNLTAYMLYLQKPFYSIQSIRRYILCQKTRNIEGSSLDTASYCRIYDSQEKLEIQPILIIP